MSKYQFNRDQLRFMEVGRSINAVVWKIVMAIVVSLLLAVVYYFLFSSFFNTPEEQQLTRDQKLISQEYDKLKGRMERLDLVLDDLEERDRETYNTLFKSDPPEIEDETNISTALNLALTSAGYYGVHHTDTTYSRLELKAGRVDQLFQSIAQSITPQKANSIPNIIPLRDFDIHRVGATVGERIHPYLKMIRLHTGLDIIATLGSDVLAPADGIVTNVSISSRESGNTLTIEHDFGYRTIYAHLSDNILVRKGQKVTKGMIIARVGNSGTSLAPHLHYEIWKGEEMMNPIHFTYAQFTPEEYRLLMIAGYNSGQSLD